MGFFNLWVKGGSWWYLDILFNNVNYTNCFPTLFLEAHQQCTFWMSPLSEQYISGPGVSTNELMSLFRCVWLAKVGKCVVLVCLQEQCWETLKRIHTENVNSEAVVQKNVLVLSSPGAFPPRKQERQCLHKRLNENIKSQYKNKTIQILQNDISVYMSHFSRIKLSNSDTSGESVSFASPEPSEF